MVPANQKRTDISTIQWRSSCKLDEDNFEFIDATVLSMAFSSSSWKTTTTVAEQAKATYLLTRKLGNGRTGELFFKTFNRTSLYLARRVYLRVQQAYQLSACAKSVLRRCELCGNCRDYCVYAHVRCSLARLLDQTGVMIVCMSGSADPAANMLHVSESFSSSHAQTTGERCCGLYTTHKLSLLIFD